MTEEYGRYLSQEEGDHLYQLALQSCHCWNAAACEAAHQAKLRVVNTSQTTYPMPFGH